MNDTSSMAEIEVARARSAAYALISYGFQYPGQEIFGALSDPARWSSWPEVLQAAVPETGEALAAVRALLGVGTPQSILDAIGTRFKSGGRDKGGWPMSFGHGEPDDTRETRPTPIIASPTSQGGGPPGQTPPHSLKEPPTNLKRAHSMDACSDWLSRYNRLFGHAVRGKCPPYELEYGRSEIIQQASILSDIAGFYAAFGMEVGRAAQDRADHVAIESEFMSLLYTKEAIALDQEHDDHLDVAVKAQRDFLKDHLACWLPAFAHRIDQSDGDGWYGAIARFASTLLAAECARFDIRPGPQTLEIHRADPVLDRTIDCATGESQVHSETGERLVQLTVDAPRDRED